MDALVIVDVQRDFLDAAAQPGVGRWQKAFCVRGVRELLRFARGNGWTIVHVGTKHANETTLPAFQRRHGSKLYCKQDTLGCEFIVPAVAAEGVLYKHAYSAFAGTELDKLIDGASNVFFAGVATDCCVQQSVFDGDHHGFRCVVPLQAVSASSIDGFVSGLAGMAKSAGDVVDLWDLLKSGRADNILEAHEVYERARAWFQAQEAVLERSKRENLVRVLDELG